MAGTYDTNIGIFGAQKREKPTTRAHAAGMVEENHQHLPFHIHQSEKRTVDSD